MSKLAYLTGALAAASGATATFTSESRLFWAAATVSFYSAYFTAILALFPSESDDIPRKEDPADQEQCNALIDKLSYLAGPYFFTGAYLFLFSLACGHDYSPTSVVGLTTAGILFIMSALITFRVIQVESTTSDPIPVIMLVLGLATLQQAYHPWS